MRLGHVCSGGSWGLVAARELRGELSGVSRVWEVGAVVSLSLHRVVEAFLFSGELLLGVAGHGVQQFPVRPLVE